MHCNVAPAASLRSYIQVMCIKAQKNNYSILLTNFQTCSKRYNISKRENH